MNRRLFLTTSCFGLAALSLPAQAQSAPDAQAMVRRVSDDLLALIRSPGDIASKRVAFTRMMEANANIRQIAGFALGRFARTMPDSMKPRYIEAFKRFIAATYVGYFDDYAGETIDIGTARPTNNGFVVDTVVNRAGEPPLSVRWDLSNRSGQLLVEDFVLEGVSMASSQRSEFSTLINSYGGNLEQFIQYLEARG